MVAGGRGRFGGWRGAARVRNVAQQPETSAPLSRRDLGWRRRRVLRMALHERRGHARPFPSRRGKYLHGVSSRPRQARARALFALAKITEPLSARTSARRTKAIRE